VAAALPLLLRRVEHPLPVRVVPEVALLPRLSNRTPGKFINVQFSIFIRLGWELRIEH
jgi:hypothetical protein